MKFLKLALAALISCFALNAQADEIILMGLSKHLNTTTAHNERNWGFGYQRSIGNRDWSVGVYRNSFWRTSTFVLTDIYKYRINDSWYFHVPAGAVTGYQKSLMPIAIPVLSYKVTSHFTIDNMILPPVGGRQGILGLQVRIKF